jgi:S1-C subfamily serine protease
VKYTFISLLATVAVTHALTTQEVVNQALPSVVAIEHTNPDGTGGEATGWFITSNRIVTNHHVIEYLRTTGITRIVNVATGQEFTVDHIAYDNTTPTLPSSSPLRTTPLACA